MKSRIVDCQAFCLHSRAYRETSLITKLFTENHGIISVVVRAAKSGSKKNAAILALLQPFAPIHISFAGKSELKTLTSIEPNGPAFYLRGPALFAGMYLNELLMRLLAEHVEYGNIYHRYGQALSELQQADSLEPALRCFERTLLENLGYGIPFVEIDQSGDSRGDLLAGEHYRFVHEAGFVRLHDSQFRDNKELVFLGEHLLKIASDEVHDQVVAAEAKRLMRMVFSPLLGNKPLNSRALFV